MRRLGSLVPTLLSATALLVAALAFLGGPVPPTEMRLASLTESVTGLLGWKSSWSATAAYVPGDTVAHAGSSWVALAPTTGVEPAAGVEAWDLVAAKGESGEQGPAGKLAVGVPIPISMPIWGTPARNATGRTVLLTMRGAVASDPGENGHLYLETAPDAGGKPGTWTRGGYVACRNAAASTGQVGCGGTLTAVLAAGAWYRMTTITIKGYTAPDFIYDNVKPATVVPLD